MPGGPSNYRYKETRTVFLHNTTIDLKNGTGTLVTWPVVDPKIQILEFGYHVVTVSGAITTGGVVALHKTLAGTGGATAIVNSLATLTFVAAVLNSKVSVNLDANQSVTPVQGPPEYPTAVDGDVLLITQPTQGVGAGAQDVKFYVVYQLQDDQVTVATAGVGSGV